MARIKDLETIRELVLEAFARIEADGALVLVGRGERYALNLRLTLEVGGVHQSDVCRVVNDLVEEGTILRDDKVYVASYGSGPEPIKQRAVEFRLAAPALV